jgi:glutathione S-transferase
LVGGFSEAKSEAPVLWHLAMSHYNEKARWALDWKRVRHTRRATVPGVHAVVASRLAGSSTFPILQIGDAVFADSTDIIAALDERWPARPLIPSDPIERQRALELEERFDTFLARAVRSLVYQHLLGDPALSAKFLSVGGGRGREFAMRLAQPVMAPQMRKLFRVPPVGDQRPLETVIAEVENLGRLTSGRTFLVGNSFSVADLSAAAFLAPFVCLDAMPISLPTPPQSLQSISRRIAAMPGGQWAAATYGSFR